MSNIDLEELKRLAEAATPGPWELKKEAGVNGEVTSVDAPNGCQGYGEIICNDETYYPTGVGPKNQAFIAAANPETVLALIRELEEAQQAKRNVCSLLDAALGQLEEARKESDKLQEICAAAYQLAGAADAPLRFLDVLANPLDATPEQIDGLLPVAEDEIGDARQQQG